MQKNYEIGDRYENLTILSPVRTTTKTGIKISRILCKCDCGKEVITTLYNLKNKIQKSCGCKQHAPKHGKTHTTIYHKWDGMLRRCLNKQHPSYHHYGGRGITVCERWLDFKNFLEDMGEPPSPKLTLDRIDNNKGYFKENCRWATQKEQCRNTRQCRYITYNGETKTIQEWTIELKLPKELLRNRINRGWEIKRAIETPPQKGCGTYKRRTP